MRILQETTEWTGQVQNHIYVLNDAMTHMIAYVPQGSDRVRKFTKPMSFDRRGRTFVEIEDGEPEPQVITVEGSKGQKYYLSNPGEGWVCTCTGFRFHGKCKHLSLVDR